MLFCEEIIIDPQTFQRTLVRLYDQISPPALPYTLDRLTVFTLLECPSKSVTRFDINILSPSGDLFCECPGAVAEWVSSTIECEPTFYDVTFRAQGTYRVRVRVGDTLVFERELPVSQ